MSSWSLVPFDAGKPNIARAYDYVLGGKDNFAADRKLTEEILRIFPLAGVLVRENREFLARAVDYVSRRHVPQFIEVGSGLPARTNTHEIAGRVSQDVRVAYVDNDPVVLSHTRVLLANSGRVAAVPGDIRCPDSILTSPDLTAVIDTSKPFCLILTMILDFVEPAQAADITAAFRHSLPAGSFLILSMGSNENAPDVAKRVIDSYTPAQVHLHSREQIAGYFAGLEMVEPGLTEARRWRPPHPLTETDTRPADVLAGVGRKVSRN